MEVSQAQCNSNKVLQGCQGVLESKLLARGVLHFSGMRLIYYPYWLSVGQRKDALNFRAQIINSPSSQRIERHILITHTIRF